MPSFQVRHVVDWYQKNNATRACHTFYFHVNYPHTSNVFETTKKVGIFLTSSAPSFFDYLNVFPVQSSITHTKTWAIGKGVSYERAFEIDEITGNRFLPAQPFVPTGVEVRIRWLSNLATSRHFTHFPWSVLNDWNGNELFTIPKLHYNLFGIRHRSVQTVELGTTINGINRPTLGATSAITHHVVDDNPRFNKHRIRKVH